MLTESLRAELAEARQTEAPERVAEFAHGLGLPADGELTDGDLEAVAAGKTFVGGGFGRGFFFGRF